MIIRFSLNIIIFAWIAINLYGETSSEILSEDAKKVRKNGLFVAPIIKATNVGEHFGMLVGFRGGWIFNHQSSFGFGLFNLVTQNIMSDNYIDTLVNKRPVMNLNFIGLEYEYIFFPESQIHLTLMSFFGAGSIQHRIRTNKTIDGKRYDPNFGERWFFAVEPSIGAEIILLFWSRIEFNVGYRRVFGLNYNFYGKNYTNDEISGFNAVVALKLGGF